MEFPANLKGGARIKVLTAMVNAQLICVSTEDPQVYVATRTGLEAIGIATQPTTKPVSGQAPEQTQRVTREGTKQSVLIDLLKRPEGATLPQMTQATGWQVHTVRGAMAGALKKKMGLQITSEKQPGLDRTLARGAASGCIVEIKHARLLAQRPSNARPARPRISPATCAAPGSGSAPCG